MFGFMIFRRRPIEVTLSPDSIEQLASALRSQDLSIAGTRERIHLAGDSFPGVVDPEEYRLPTFGEERQSAAAVPGSGATASGVEDLASMWERYALYGVADGVEVVCKHPQACSPASWLIGDGESVRHILHTIIDHEVREHQRVTDQHTQAPWRTKPQAESEKDRGDTSAASLEDRADPVGPSAGPVSDTRPEVGGVYEGGNERTGAMRDELRLISNEQGYESATKSDRTSEGPEADTLHWVCVATTWHIQMSPTSNVMLCLDRPAGDIYATADVAPGLIPEDDRLVDLGIAARPICSGCMEASDAIARSMGAHPVEDGEPDDLVITTFGEPALGHSYAATTEEDRARIPSELGETQGPMTETEQAKRYHAGSLIGDIAINIPEGERLWILEEEIWHLSAPESPIVRPACGRKVVVLTGKQTLPKAFMPRPAPDQVLCLTCVGLVDAGRPTRPWESGAAQARRRRLLGLEEAVPPLAVQHPVGERDLTASDVRPESDEMRLEAEGYVDTEGSLDTTSTDITRVLDLPRTCPKCGHAWHVKPCLNLASDNDCAIGCLSSVERVPVADFVQKAIDDYPSGGFVQDAPDLRRVEVKTKVLMTGARGWVRWEEADPWHLGLGGFTACHVNIRNDDGPTSFSPDKPEAGPWCLVCEQYEMHDQMVLEHTVLDTEDEPRAKSSTMGAETFDEEPEAPSPEAQREAERQIRERLHGDHSEQWDQGDRP